MAASLAAYLVRVRVRVSLGFGFGFGFGSGLGLGLARVVPGGDPEGGERREVPWA